MVCFNFILGMDWLNDCFASIACRTRIVKFNFPNKLVLHLKWGNSIPTGPISSYVKACEMIAKGYIYHIVRVKY